MQPVLIVIHLLVVIALVGVVLIQRSEGGGLGIGGGSGFMTARGTRNALTRLTAILAGCFFLTSIILTVLQATLNPTSAPDLLDRINEFGSEFGGALGGQVGGQAGDEIGEQVDDNILLPDELSTQTPPAPVLTIPDLASPADSLVPAPSINEGETAPVPDR